VSGKRLIALIGVLALAIGVSGHAAAASSVVSQHILAAKAGTEAPRLLGPGTSFGSHVEDQLATRGWTKRLVQSTIDDPGPTVATRDIRNLPGGGRMDDAATGDISRRGGYVVRNDRTGDIVQVSNRTKSGWSAPWDR
jgi:hypothetical protein